jgi:hypothetical protein
MRSAKNILSLLIIISFFGCNFINTNKAKKLNSIGVRYSAEGKSKMAINYFLAAARTKYIPDSLRSYYLGNIGGEYWTKNVDSAKFYYYKAAKLNDKNSYYGLYFVANVYVLDNQIAKALDALLKAYKIDSVNMLANNLLGLIYMGENDTAHYAPYKALKYNRRSYSKFKDVNSEFALAKNYYLIDDMQQSVHLFEDICRRSPEFTPFKTDLIMIYQELGRKGDAEKLLAELKNEDPLRYNSVIKANCKEGEHYINWQY